MATENRHSVKEINPNRPFVHPEAIELYNEGLSYAKHDRLTEAIPILLEAVKVDPNYINAYNLLGKIYMQAGQTDKARECWLNALKLDPLNLVAMDCLEASTPKSFLDKLRNLILLVGLLLVLGGGAAIFWKFDRLESKLDNITLLSQPAEVQPLNGDTSMDLSTPVSVGSRATSGNSQTEAMGSTASTQPSKQPVQMREKHQSAPEITLPPTESAQSEVSATSGKPDRVVSNVAIYEQAVKNLVPKGRYQEAVQTLTKLVEGNLEHRYLVGNSYFWLGVCYRRLDQPIKAMRAFQNVTKENSFKYDDAQTQIRSLQ